MSLPVESDGDAYVRELSARASQREASGVRLYKKPTGAAEYALGCETGTPTVKVVDTTVDTTQRATRSNRGQPLARKSA